MTRYRAIRELSREFRSRGFAIVILNPQENENFADFFILDYMETTPIFINNIDDDGEKLEDALSFARLAGSKYLAEKSVNCVHIMLTGSQFIVKMISSPEQFVELYGAARSDTIQHNTILSVEECANEIERITGRES